MGAPITRRPSTSSSASSTSTPRSPQRVVFATQLVTGVSRQPHNTELWTFYDFEAHAARCSHCTQPLEVSAEGKRLCTEGHDLAVEVAKLVFRRRDGHVYFRKREAGQEVRVEMPGDYPQVASLLHAIERCLKRGEKFVKPGRYSTETLSPPASPTLQRVSARRTTEPRETYEVRVVEPARSPRRSHTEKDTSPRGSLYSSDMEELHRDHQREKRLGYNLEVREPTSGHSRRRSQTYFGYN